MKIFSGIRPTGGIHIGNYLGAIKNWVKLQEEHDCLFCVVDWHAITTPYEVEKLDDYIYETSLAYLAAGIDPEQNVFFLQSQVKEHAELAWLLGCLTPVGQLKRITQYKQKSKKLESPKAALLNYPVLMAADILLYQTEAVPVGEDQKQHVEIARDTARRFNHRFGKTLTVPEIITPEMGARIMSLTNPENKMSKSGDPKGCIGLFESPDSIRKKVMGAVTDTGDKVKYDPRRKPGISNLVTIYSCFSEKERKEIQQKFKGKGYAEFKKKLADLLIGFLAPFRTRRKKTSTKEIKKILAQGSDRARNKARKTMTEVRKKMGLGFRP